MTSAVVVGAGVFGASTARELDRRGWDVTLVEQYTPGHVRSGSGGDTRLLRFSHGEVEWYTLLARRALELNVRATVNRCHRLVCSAVQTAVRRRPRPRFCRFAARPTSMAAAARVALRGPENTSSVTIATASAPRPIVILSGNDVAETTTGTVISSENGLVSPPVR